jgi:ethanolamine utilization protein EutN
MQGWKLLVVEPLAADGRSPDGDPILAVDSLGAGRGEIVIISSDVRGIREQLHSDTTPVCWSVIGIRD